MKTKNLKINTKSSHKRLVKECEALWSECIKARAGYKSELSFARENLNSHHIVGKPNYLLRFSLDNGICLTGGEHIYGVHNEGRRAGFEEKIRRVRGADIYDRLRQMTWVNTKTDLAITKIYLKQKLEEFKKGQK